MKKYLMIAMAVLCLALVGCGAKHTNAKEEKVVEGTLQEKKDFMFTIEEDADTFYGFSFEEKPDGYDALKNGDTVKVVYNGELSEVDPFTGDIISIEKVK